jgi:hypothetical protein
VPISDEFQFRRGSDQIVVVDDELGRNLLQDGGVVKVGGQKIDGSIDYLDRLAQTRRRKTPV